MIKYGVADYGLLVWYGNYYDYEERIMMVKELGFDGLERLYTTSAEETLTRGAFLKKNGMDFATVNAHDVEHSIKWTAAMGKKYVWLNVMGGNCGRGGDYYGQRHEDYIRQINDMTRVCNKYGIDAVLHNHLGQPAESQEEIETILRECPDTKLLFDVGHCAVAGGDVRYMVETYYDRIAAFHFKGWKISDTPDSPAWDRRGHFCGLGQGDFNVDNEYVFKYAVKKGYDGWFFIEQDTHLQDPRLDLAESLGIMKKWESEVK